MTSIRVNDLNSSESNFSDLTDKESQSIVGGGIKAVIHKVALVVEHAAQAVADATS